MESYTRTLLMIKTRYETTRELTHNLLTILGLYEKSILFQFNSCLIIWLIAEL